VVGTSGSGKSSLVRSGLIPSLQSGFMVGAGSSWRMAVLRPGEDPIGHLAAALNGPGVLGAETDLTDTNRLLLEVTLRRTTRGLAEAVRQARLPAGDNVLVVIDQFEELFRFRHSRQIAHSRDDAIAFVRLLLEAAAQHEHPIYIVLTMRSDFIGDCMDFPGLPEAINAGLYLVGRMSRDALRSAITGPVAVAGASIAPRLVNRVLNDLGDDHDQLPLVQHALMRTWEHWARAREGQGPIDVEDYEAVGTFRHALSKHAEEAYEEAARIGHAVTVERIFRALTDTFTDPRGIRRPTLVSELAAIDQAAEDDVIRAVDIFRAPRRCFLMPPAGVPLTGRSIVDLSHESLMRCWDRLIRWADEERAAAEFYIRLSQAARWCEAGAAGLWRDPELELAQTWRTGNAPTAAWAARYDEGFDRAIGFLDRSLKERDRLAAEREQERRAKLRRTQLVAGVLATLLVVAIGLGTFAWNERQRARANLDLARQAVDESLAAADRDPAQIGADVPQVQELRRELLSKAEGFYLAFMDQEPRSEQARRDLAVAHLRLGHINRMLDRRDQAEAEYRDAIARLTAMTAGAGGAPEDRQALASAYNWLGETLRRQIGRAPDAAEAYDRALELQQALTNEFPAHAAYREELARTMSNRGILRFSAGDVAAAEADFRAAIQLLEPLSTTSPRALQDLGRAANNLAALLDSQARDDAQTWYARAVAAHEQLVAQELDNSEYRLELATFANNLAVFLYEHGAAADAVERSQQAVDLLTALARPAPSLAIERADAYTLRGMILEAQRADEAYEAFETALALFGELQESPRAVRMQAFHTRFGDLLLHLAALGRDPAATERGRRLLTQAVTQYADLAHRLIAADGALHAGVITETLTAVIPELEGPNRVRLLAIEEQLRRTTGGRG
jgi:tetratricopeptide (TPR) repeat protein